MAVKNAKRPAQRARLVAGTTQGDPTVSRHIGEAVDAVERLDDAAKSRNVIAGIDLVVGANRINHGLGRRARGFTVTPTVADASFAAALTSSDETQAVITVVGTPQPKATLELF